ncbi:MAG: Membrane-bound lytic murein transglycosylase C [Candidatus Celerinatantimonas neptuna]|nr:MAG: Membrane-bound lytic murein transglycosylase C [Candidatus Celerinatantimonas neptuna]
MKEYLIALVVGVLVAIAPFMSVASGANSYQQWLQKQQTSFHQYKTQYQQRYQAFKRKLREKWQTHAEMPGRQQYVQYSPDLSVKTVLDYAHNEIRVESIDGKSLPSSSAVLAQLSKETVTQTLKSDLLLKLKKVSQKKQTLLESMTGEKRHIPETQVTHKQLKGDKGQIIQQMTIKLDIQTKRRAGPYLSQVHRLARQYQLDPALILSVIKTESAFNPLAQSPIPAFGLMQIVPASAGLDVNQKLNRIHRHPSKEDLFDAKTNLQFGSGYLYLLNQRYLASIKDQRSRMYCMIAAYNTGMGNVASAFNSDRSKRLKPAVKIINRLSFEQVYQHLEHHLPYQETRRYLKKVTSAYRVYSGSMTDKKIH